MRIPSLVTATCLGLALLAPVAPRAMAAEGGATKAEVEALIDQAQTWLSSRQGADGTFAKDQFALGITALAADALAAQPRGLPGDGPVLAKTFAYLKSHQQPDGGIYLKEQGLGNYCTSITLMALGSAGRLQAEAEVVKKAQGYLFGLQRADGDKLRDGGIGYSENHGKGHEDLTNTTMAVLGMKESGVPATDEHMQKALKFLERCQNLSSVNDAPWVDNEAGRGSAVYAPDESKANGSFQEPANKSDPVKKLVGTGSCTYALISSYVALDLKPEDPRVSAALDWVKRNYRFDANPGMSAGHEKEGLLYYYMFMAKTMRLLGIKELTLADGKKVDWRADLLAAIKAVGKDTDVGGKKGTMFMNEAKRWAEAFPELGTAYMVKALKDIHASL